MSKIGKKIIEFDKNLELNFDEKTRIFSVRSGQKYLAEYIQPGVNLLINRDSSQIVLTINDEHKKNLWGLSRTLISNMVKDIIVPYNIKLELHGVGYRCIKSGNSLVLSVGFSHDVNLLIPEGIELEVVDSTVIDMKGYNRVELGNFAARVRSIRPPEPYKGKGIRYSHEKILKKEVKSAA